MNIENYLSVEEKKNLNMLNTKSNIINKKLLDSNNVLNLSINEVIKIWSTKMQEILNDLINYNYKQDFKHIKTVLDYLTVMINIFNKIFIKNNRSFYSGITFILISMFIYIIGISS